MLESKQTVIQQEKKLPCSSSSHSWLFLNASEGAGLKDRAQKTEMQATGTEIHNTNIKVTEVLSVKNEFYFLIKCITYRFTIQDHCSHF